MSPIVGSKKRPNVKVKLIHFFKSFFGLKIHQEYDNSFGELIISYQELGELKNSSLEPWLTKNVGRLSKADSRGNYQRNLEALSELHDQELKALKIYE